MSKLYLFKPIFIIGLTASVAACSDQPIGMAKNPIGIASATIPSQNDYKPILLAPEAYALPPSAMSTSSSDDPGSNTSIERTLPCMSVGACSD